MASINVGTTLTTLSVSQVRTIVAELTQLFKANAETYSVLFTSDDNILITINILIDLIFTYHISFFIL